MQLKTLLCRVVCHWADLGGLYFVFDRGMDLEMMMLLRVMGMIDIRTHDLEGRTGIRSCRWREGTSS